MEGEITWPQVAMLIPIAAILIGGMWGFLNTRKTDLDKIYGRIEKDVTAIMAQIKESSDQTHTRINETNRALADLNFKIGELSGRAQMVEQIVLKNIGGD